MILESNQFQDLKNLRNFGYFAGFWYSWSEPEKIDDVILSSLFGQFLGSHDLKMPSVLLIFKIINFFFFPGLGTECSWSKMHDYIWDKISTRFNMTSKITILLEILRDIDKFGLDWKWLMIWSYQTSLGKFLLTMTRKSHNASSSFKIINFFSFPGLRTEYPWSKLHARKWH